MTPEQERRVHLANLFCILIQLSVSTARAFLVQTTWYLWSDSGLAKSGRRISPHSASAYFLRKLLVPSLTTTVLHPVRKTSVSYQAAEWQDIQLESSIPRQLPVYRWTLRRDWQARSFRVFVATDPPGWQVEGLWCELICYGLLPLESGQFRTWWSRQLQNTRFPDYVQPYLWRARTRGSDSVTAILRFFSS